MARALLVGCGCRGRELGRLLLAGGWQVRGTTRHEDRLSDIAAAGIEPALADPDRVGTVLDHVADVAVVAWLLGSAAGEADSVAALHGPRLERLLEELVDTPVRGVVYERAGSAGPEALASGAWVMSAAGTRWRIRFELVEHDPGDWQGWAGAAANACRRVLNS